MPAKFLSTLVALVALAGVTPAQPVPKPVDDTELVTKTYTVKQLMGDKGKGADALLNLIFQGISFGDAKGGDGPQVIERDGGKLEVRATAKTHAEIRDLFDALARLQDVAIDIKADVIELDTAAYDKLAKTLPKGKAKPPVLLATGEAFEGKDAPPLDEVNTILKAGRVVQTSSARFANGAEATVSARRNVVRFTNDGGPAWKPADNPLFVKEGFALVAVPVVSADRRFVRLKLTEQSTAITGVKKRELFELEGKKVVAQSPETEDLGATGSAEVADGGTLLFRLAYAPKDKVWVVVVKPTIFIQAEEDELKKQEKK